VSKRACMTSVAFVALLFSAAGIAATSQAYPSRPVRLLIGYAPGGSDVSGRLLAQKLAEKFGQPFVIDNRPGASSVLATDLLSKAPPDGYTLIYSTAAHSVTAVFYEKLPYDPIRDFAPVSRVGSVPFVLVTHPSFPATTLKEFVAVARQKPGGLNHGSAGTGGIGHLAQALFCKQAGFEGRHIGYKGTGPAVMAIVSGEIHFGMPNLVGAMPQVRAGKLRAYATATATRTTLAPEIPTLAEAGVPGVEAGTWYGVNAPRGTPRPVIQQLNREIVAILESPAFREQFAALGVESEPSTPEAFAAFIRSEIEKWGGVMKFAGIKKESY
jgi:tripartite-type tricarboxylate transporter receptor subunit TctC